ncbi:MAG: MMPL family transporter [Gammaproteobacteria bacterium]|nr:MMPL family transporter [Gammaproteobacteria bacterium]
MPDSKSIFFQFGQHIYRFRKFIICFWVIVMMAGLPFLTNIIDPFESTGFVAKGSQSDLTDRFLNKKLGYGHNQFIVLYHSKHLKATDPKYISRVKKSLSGLKHIGFQYEVIYPQASEISTDQHTAYVSIFLKTNKTLSDKELKKFTDAIKKPKYMTMQLGGEPIFIENINKQTQKDLYKADMIAAPVSLITLLIIFGTIVATIVPIVIGAGCATIILTTLYTIGHFTDLSIFTLNIALLLGLCLSLDYALFMINRFREELALNKSIEICTQTTLATAGKAVFYSGLAVFTSLSALLFFPINILTSIGIGGLVAVFVAVATALTLLPATLAVLGTRINSLEIRKIQPKPMTAKNKRNIWYKIAHAVVCNPIKYFFFTLLFLLFLAYTVLNIQIGISDLKILPAHSSNQMFFNAYEKNFNEHELNPILMVVASEDGRILSPKNLSKLYDLVEAIKNNPSVDEVNSIVSIKSSMNKQQYEILYQSKIRSPDLKQFLQQSTRHQFTVISIISRHPADSLETQRLITDLRNLKPGKDLKATLTGMPVVNAEVLATIKRIAPYAALWVFGLTYIVLLVLLRSLLLPLKAIFMNILSLCTSYGVLVYIFQEGHFHTILGFNPQGILDVNLIVIIFCALFGFSMDYEVFLLTRIQEAYHSTKNTEKSIIFGIVRSSRIITSAALIVIVLCGSFMVADVLMVKQFGLGIAVAIFVDAFAIRTILVPAAMALLKDWNWYLPKWIGKRLK